MIEDRDDSDSERDSDEGPFARDLNGFLMRLDKPTEELFQKAVTLTIDGQPVTVKKAVPAVDATGQPLYRDGKPIPRATTIYDASCQLLADIDQWKKAGRPPTQEYHKSWIEEGNQIPILCHQPHQDPVAVCRVCSVFITRPGAESAPRKLLPACQHLVEDQMVVYTRAYREDVPFPRGPENPGRMVGDTVQMLLKLLVRDHLPNYRPEAAHGHNELDVLAHQLKLEPSRWLSPPASRVADLSSPVIAVDHAACILCDRCVRGCNEVRNNFVLGRTGKGPGARIGFGLGLPGPTREVSGCVECMECVISCPTSALTARQHIESPVREGPGELLGPVPADELLKPPWSELFSGIPRKFLEWNASAVVRRRVPPREVLMHEGKSGSHAYLLERGRLVARRKAPLFHVHHGQSIGLLSRLQGHAALSAQSRAERRFNRGPGAAISILSDFGGVSVGGASPEKHLIARGEPVLQLLGETACLNRYPYDVTVTAIDESIVLEINRNVLLQMLRVPRTRDYLEKLFRKDALEPYLVRLPLFRTLEIADSQRLTRQLAPHIKLERVGPDQPVYEQGDEVDACFIVRVGSVRVAQKHGEQETVVGYVGPTGLFGYEELLEVVAGRTARRTTSCRALDHVELLRIPGQAFADVIRADKAIHQKLLDTADRTKHQYDAQHARAERPLPNYLDRGLHHARSLLVLDLDKCTRCDECTRACADTHDGITRLIREGLRFENYLVATSCRSCLDPTCMIGCPVDAIHRTGKREIHIEDSCIGCEQCARSCPYGNIHMARVELREEPEGPVKGRWRDLFSWLPGVKPRQQARVAIKATTCDLCKNLSPTADPSCVYACPHDAAHRMNGRELYQQVLARRKANGEHPTGSGEVREPAS